MRDEANTGEHGSVATEAEAFRFLSDVMRGTLTEPGGKAVSVGDRLKACSGLLKLFEIHEEESAAGERELALAAASERIGRSIAPGFAPVLGDVLVHGHTHYDLPGGRGSMKSSFVSLTVVYLLLLEKNAHALVLRKVANTMRDSVYAQYLWALEQLGVQQFFDCKLSPMELVFRPTGQSTMRGGERFWNFESYNPPLSRDNWANLDSALERPDRLCHRSTYLEAPREWLGEQFITEAESLRESDERAYQHEYLGLAVGTGGNVFEHLELREISEEEVKRFDRIYMGVDWGFAPDPFAFIRLHYDPARETIYLIDELCARRQTNTETARELLRRGYQDGIITCDSAEPKSVADYRSLGLNARTAVKGPGSVEYGMKWLQGRTIVIDRRRTPEAWREFSGYEFERDRDGNFISGYPDRENHTIDAVRYALERMYGKYRSRA